MTCSFGPPLQGECNDEEKEEEQYKKTIHRQSKNPHSEQKRNPEQSSKSLAKSKKSTGSSKTFPESDSNQPPSLLHLGPKPSSSRSPSLQKRIYHSEQQPYPSSNFRKSTFQTHLDTRTHSFLFLNLNQIDYIDSGPSVERSSSRLGAKRTSKLKLSQLLRKESKTASSSEKPSLASSSSSAQSSTSPSKKPSPAPYLNLPADYNHHSVSSQARTMVHPNQIVYRKMEALIKQMLSAEDGVPIKTVKSFLSKIPSVFTGQDIIAWILRNVDVVDLADALHLAHMLASHGYIFQIDDHVLTVKNDGTFYRFQTPYFWPSNCWQPENTDYAVYLCKRTMQNKAHLELEDFEAENLAKLQKMFSRKWEFVYLQSEAQYKVDKKRDRLERQILDSQERAFWDVHRPVPGCVNTTEVDFRKLSRSGRPKYSATSTSMMNAIGHSTAFGDNYGCSTSGASADPTATDTNGGSEASGLGGGSGSVYNREHRPYQRPGLRRCTHLQDSLKHEISQLQGRLSKNVLKTSKVIENYLQYYDHRKYFDGFLVVLGSANDPFQSHSNPWISDTIDFWQHDKTSGDISTRRLKLWEESFEELLCDQLGRETLQKFLDKEYSGENLRFWWEVQKLRKCSSRMVPVLVTEIYSEFIDSNATSPVNIDCKVMEITEENLLNPNRWSFDEAADHIFCLMKNDSYQRFLRSEIYRDLVNLSRKKSSLSALISRKTSRKVPTAPRTFSSKSANTSASTSQLGAAGHDFRAHSYHHHPPHQPYLSSSLGATSLGPSTSVLTASTTSIGSAGAPQRDSHSPVSHCREQSPLLHHHHMLNQGSFDVIRPGVTFSSQGSQFTIQATPLPINQGNYSSSSGSGTLSQGAHTRSTSALGQPQFGSLSGPAGTPTCYPGTSTNQGLLGSIGTLPNLAVDFVDKGRNGGSDSETVTTSTTTTTFLQLPED